MTTRYPFAGRPSDRRPAARPCGLGGSTPGRAAVAVALLQLVGLVPLAGGCVPMAAAWANLTGGDWVEPQFRLAKQPLLVLIDDPDGIVTEPKAIREVHQTISEIFAANKVNQMIVPFAEWQRLQQTDRKYPSYSIRQIGEKLGAEQVLYIKVERFSLHAEAGAPVFKGDFSARVKVLATDRRADVRLWPGEEVGKLVSSSTAPTPADGDKSAGDIAAELGIKLGQQVARLFYGYRELQT